MWENLSGFLNYWLAAVLLLIGLYGMLARHNLVKKLMAMNILQVAVILFFVALAEKTGATAPIEVKGLYDVGRLHQSVAARPDAHRHRRGRQHHGRGPGAAHSHPTGISAPWRSPKILERMRL